MSFNWGKIFHLPAVLELVPLGFFWAFCAYIGGKKNDRLQTGAICSWIVILFLTPAVFTFWMATHKPETGPAGRYYPNKTFEGPPAIVERSGNLFFDWARIAPLEPPFSAEWSAKVHIAANGSYTFCTISDDASWVWLNDQLVVKNDGIHDLKKSCGAANLHAGDQSIRVRYVNYQGRSGMRLLWKPPGGIEGPVPAAALID